jgi:hypothetical protein
LWQFIQVIKQPDSLYLAATARLSRGVRRLEIRQLIDDYEDVIRESSGASDSLEQIGAFHVAAKDKMLAEITANSPSGEPNKIAELYQDVIAELSLRLRMLRP